MNNWYSIFKKALISDESNKKLDQYGFKTVEKNFIGPYEIYLIYNTFGNFYQIGLQTNKTQFADLKDQFSKQEIPETASHNNIIELIDIIKSWQQKYGKIFIGSENKTKEKKYISILKGFGFNPISSIDPSGQKRHYI